MAFVLQRKICIERRCRTGCLGGLDSLGIFRVESCNLSAYLGVFSAFCHVAISLRLNGLLRGFNRLSLGFVYLVYSLSIRY